MLKNTFFLIALILCPFINAQDTFSIVAVDPATGEVGSAGASCVDGAAGIGGIINVVPGIIPGRGAINSQALVCIPNINLENALAQMDAGSSPNEIITWLMNNDQCSAGNFSAQQRQYGIADLDIAGNPRTAGFTGFFPQPYKEDRQGLTYSIQGNILLGQSIIDDMETNFNNTVGSLAEKLMASMQGANVAGADTRCLERGTSSTTAWLMVYQPDDDIASPYLQLSIEEMPFGEEPIDSLQVLFDNFFNLSVQESTLDAKLKIFPNPVVDKLKLDIHNSVVVKSIEIFDVIGKLVNEEFKMSYNGSQNEIDVSVLKSGVYFLRVNTLEGTKSFKFVKI
ncbi:MAG: DUF1028 domain-containing protein [Bacteroidia bacterium]|nr:DUF1028 domain-containing protein [Bacteroidia bacterium]NNF83148.1 DUF1028 domain-containing protein [Flavobacteriaceae bacterium]NNK71145.1 DUF1028 domain-containing protein [Flavobacteriaceae bacterium]NNL79410.1 DUF1028 domain-containing protein [Flavobacteriaceae bacterium]